MAAVLLERSLECGQCGTASWQWEEDPNAFVPVTHICLGCAAKDRVRSDADDAPKQPGSSIRLVTRDTAARLVETAAKRPRSARERARGLK